MKVVLHFSGTDNSGIMGPSLLTSVGIPPAAGRTVLERLSYLWSLVSLITLSLTIAITRVMKVQLAPDFCEPPLRAVSLQVALFSGFPALPLLSPALIVAQRLSWVHLPVYRRSEACPMSLEEMTDYGRSDGTMR